MCYLSTCELSDGWADCLEKLLRALTENEWPGAILAHSQPLHLAARYLTNLAHCSAMQSTAGV